MAANRTLMAVLVGGLAVHAAAAQPGLTPPAPASSPSAGGNGQPSLSGPREQNPALASPGTGQTNEARPSATNALTAPVTGVPPGGSGQLPAGSYAGPFCGPNAAGCNGPVGANGPLTYELYFHTGPNLIVGGGREFQAALDTGWTVAGGARNLHFNVAGDAAWVFSAGINYTYNGSGRDYIGVATRRPPFFDPNNPNDPRNGQVIDLSEPVNAFRVKAYNRTALEFAVGRDVWLNGPAPVGYESGVNHRVGWDVGGRWGFNSISLRPLENPANYFRRSGVFHALTVGAHYTVEVPMGAWIGFVGGRAQWGYNFTNVVPPVSGDIQDVGLLLTAGVRF